MCSCSTNYHNLMPHCQGKKSVGHKIYILALQFFRVSPVTANPNSAVPLFVPVQTRNAVSDLTGATR